MSSSSSSGGGSLSNTCCSRMTWHVEHASEPSHAPSRSTSFACATSSSVLPSGAETHTSSPLSMKTTSTWPSVHSRLRCECPHSCAIAGCPDQLDSLGAPRRMRRMRAEERKASIEDVPKLARYW
eukprot:CAMPEP_0119359826 /NCGR_PEP_ID=MMETSP1334-20130426/7617_1 /TAXON_ID=127549 /ORGANISM="Calcidiscus leptoporus, Strain RCC1130" /LENGTH=124 /DNA_ID=CAMNT_0007374565 /DNA_START=287 /DNA_END=658 /DNA_ORIENTATION=-